MLKLIKTIGVSMLCLFLSLLFTTTLSAQTGWFSAIKSGHADWYANVGLGQTFYKVGEPQSSELGGGFSPGPSTVKTLSESQSPAFSLSGGLTISHNALFANASGTAKSSSRSNRFFSHVAYSLGLQYIHFGKRNLKRDLSVAPGEGDFFAKQAINSSAVLMLFQPAYYFRDNISAFAELGLGLGQASIDGAGMSPLSNTGSRPAGAPYMESSKSIGFAYAVGLGGAYHFGSRGDSARNSTDYKGKLGVTPRDSFSSRLPYSVAVSYRWLHISGGLSSKVVDKDANNAPYLQSAIKTKALAGGLLSISFNYLF